MITESESAFGFQHHFDSWMEHDGIEKYEVGSLDIYKHESETDVSLYGAIGGSPVFYKISEKDQGKVSEVRWLIDSEASINYIRVAEGEDEDIELVLGTKFRDHMIETLGSIYLINGENFVGLDGVGYQPSGLVSLSDKQVVLGRNIFGFPEKVTMPYKFPRDPWLSRFFDRGDELALDPRLPYLNWFNKLGIGYEFQRHIAT